MQHRQSFFLIYKYSKVLIVCGSHNFLILLYVEFETIYHAADLFNFHVKFARKCMLHIFFLKILFSKDKHINFADVLSLIANFYDFIKEKQLENQMQRSLIFYFYLHLMSLFALRLAQIFFSFHILITVLTRL